MRARYDYSSKSGYYHIIHDYAQKGDLDLLKSAINKSNINIRDSKGYTPLMFAAYYGHHECVSYLIEHGADINSVDHLGNSILMAVSYKGYLEIVKMLISADVDLEYRNYKGQSALDFAKIFGRLEIVEYIKNLDKNPKELSIWNKIYNFLTFLAPDSNKKNG